MNKKTESKVLKKVNTGKRTDGLEENMGRYLINNKY